MASLHAGGFTARSHGLPPMRLAFSHFVRQARAMAGVAAIWVLFSLSLLLPFVVDPCCWSRPSHASGARSGLFTT